MTEAIERIQTLGEIPGHVFRDTRGREHDRHSVLIWISHRVQGFGRPEGKGLELDVFPRKSDISERVTRLRYGDWESRSQEIDFEGEPISSRKNSPEVIVENMAFYSTGDERPTLKENLTQAGVTKEAVDHFLLDSPNSSQTERLSEALKRQKEGTLTNRWKGYLRFVKARLVSEHTLAFKSRR